MMAELCLRHDLTIIRTKSLRPGLQRRQHVHRDAVTGARRRTITLIAPSKTFNIAGLYCSAAIIPDPELRRRFKAVAGGSCRASI